jgi:hypothetical protein
MDGVEGLVSDVLVSAVLVSAVLVSDVLGESVELRRASLYSDSKDR